MNASYSSQLRKRYTLRVLLMCLEGGESFGSCSTYEEGENYLPGGNIFQGVRRKLWIKVCYELFNQIGNYRNIMQIQFSSRKKNSWSQIWVIKIRVLRKVFGNFTLSDTEDNTSGSLHREAITDFRDLSGLTIWVR